MKMIFGHDEALAQWATRRIPNMTEYGFGPCRAIGVASDDTMDAELYAVCVYHGYVEAKNWKTMQISIAARSPVWAAKGIVRALLSVPFEQYKVNKLYSIMAASNERAIKFNLGLGFRKETILRHHFGQNRHGFVTYLFATDYFQNYGGGRIPKMNKEKASHIMKKAA